MKNLSKLITLVIVFSFSSVDAHSQSFFLKALNGFNGLVEGIGTFFTSNNKIDSLINSDKPKKWPLT
jgi:hypothetical protein